VSLFAQDNNSSPLSEGTLKGLQFRNIGPAFTSGRISDIAIHPENDNIWYVTVGSGSVWKTVNSGVTWTPIFDSQPVYSTGCVSIDPTNPNVVWVGTGEDVGGRHVGIGDGVYKSTDGGKSWKNMGLKTSEHIARVVIHPENSDIVFVASQGPLWNKGGERGLYKSTDGGENWKKVLGDDEWIGATDLVVDPRDPDLMYAATWQRHRNVASYMGGGPGSGVHRSTDGGDTWEKLANGIPKSNLGKIGLAISPQNPDKVYAAIETDRRTGGLFMSTDRGTSWNKQSSAVSGATGPHYYQELFASPHSEGRLYLMDASMQVSDDDGKTFRRMNESKKHSDNHAIAFRKDDPNYLLVGSDGGLYESFDLEANWRYMGNLPVTQYYKLALDDAEPFYNIFGGTQDNGSHGGPSRTDNGPGIINEDWRSILGADGHQTATEPGNPNIVYAETQEGGLHRIDRITGEQVMIQPQAGEGDPHERTNWDAPILVSPHNPARIYHASYRVWRSENRGDSWTAISGDLTRNQDRMNLPIMGRKQSWDNAWDYYAMSTYNTITSLAESPLQEGLIYAGTDDGIIQVTEDGGTNWRKLEVGSIKDVPATAFVNDIRADLFDAKTVYACLDNHKFGDYKPHILKSIDAGRTWSSISGNLPAKHLVWRLVQDHIVKELMFAATEYGIFFTPDGGSKWIKLDGGVPTISFRDITIQRRENDLVGASFGRGFFVLDDYSPLREMVSAGTVKEATLFPVKDAWWYFSKDRWINGGDKYVAPNPPTGAVFTYYLPEAFKTKKSERQEKEKSLNKEGKDIPFPGWEKIDEENSQKAPEIRLTIKDANGNLVNTLKGKASKGINRVNWDMKHSSKMGIKLGQPASTWGPIVVPGTYSVSLSKVVDGEQTELSGPQSFTLKPLRKGALEGASDSERMAFYKEMEAFQQDILATTLEFSKSRQRVDAMLAAILQTDRETGDLEQRILQADKQFYDLNTKFFGSPSANQVGEKTPPSPRQRLGVAISGWSTSYGPTELHKQSLATGKSELAKIKTELSELVDVVLPQIEKDLKAAGAPWIEGQGLIK
ncbi:glycosyl hydrolase, partial [Bacteroidota bacterium]